ncbi:MAG: malic enzyme-like NAD(P)-binding protein, partial [Opitutales bacterium]
GKTFVPRQGNNSYIFPGVGLGLIVSQARRVTDEMFFVAAQTLAGLVTPADLECGRVYPDLHRIREVSAAIAEAVANVAFQRSLTSMLRPENLTDRVHDLMYDPTYVEYV